MLWPTGMSSPDAVWRLRTRPPEAFLVALNKYNTRTYSKYPTPILVHRENIQIAVVWGKVQSPSNYYVPSPLRLLIDTR